MFSSHPTSISSTLSTQQSPTISDNLHPSQVPILPTEQFKCYLCQSISSIQPLPPCQLCSNTGFILGSDPLCSLIFQVIALSSPLPEPSHIPSPTPIDLDSDSDPDTSTLPQLSIHQNIICDGCQMDPITGIRYSCKQCNDFDLCENCYKRRKHNHKKFQKIGKNGVEEEESSVKRKLTQGRQKEKLMGLGRELIWKITQLL